MAYHPPTQQPQTAWAVHLDRIMREQDWSKVQLFEEIGPLLGYRLKSRSTVYKLLGDREPTAGQVEVLRARFGDPDPLPTAELPADPRLTEHQELIKALREQTTAINSLVGRLDSLASDAIRAGVMDALREAGVPLGGAAS